MTNAVIQNLQTTNKTVVGAINELNSKMKIITINGTTLQDGTISLPYDVPDGVNQAYCISNVSANLSMPYSVTVMDVDSKSILFRIRKMGDNSAIANTAVNFDVLVFFI